MHFVKLPFGFEVIEILSFRYKTLIIKFKDAAGVFGKLDVAFRRILYFLPDEDKKTLRCVSSW